MRLPDLLLLIMTLYTLPVQATGAYQPTRDLSGAQRATLQQAADAAISCFEAAIADEGALAAGGQEQGAAAAEVLAQLLPACCSAICAVLDLDHRSGLTCGTLQHSWDWHNCAHRLTPHPSPVTP